MYKIYSEYPLIDWCGDLLYDSKVDLIPGSIIYDVLKHIYCKKSVLPSL